MPTIEQSKKANEKQRKRKESPEIFVERVHKDEKRTRIDYPNVQPKVLYVFFLQSLVPRLIWSLQIMRILRFYHIYCQWKKKQEVVHNMCILIRPKKIWSCFRKSTGWKKFYHLPACISEICMRIYIKHTYTHTQT